MILGLYISTSITGYAIIDLDGRLIEIGSWDTRNKNLYPDLFTKAIFIKKQLMQLEFDYNMQLKGVDVEGMKSREKQKEDRKDERTRIQASQQSELIEQRKAGGKPKNFESAGNDTIGSGFGLEAFGPK